ncbi:MAG: hypothetical protein LBH97_06600 [Treponema sp.]|jgi:hypothetical protein|nr:hypothetical protein [Treponema sp.]
MKKFILFTFAALVTALFLAACASGGSTAISTGPQERKPWRLAREEGGIAVRNNQVTLRKGEQYLYIYFPVPGSNFDKLSIDFTVDRPVGVTWQCVYQPGAVWGDETFIGNIDKGPIENDLMTGFDKVWFNMTEFKSVEKSEINGACLKINDPEGRAVFTLTDVSFLGLEE